MKVRWVYFTSPSTFPLSLPLPGRPKRSRNEALNAALAERCRARQGEHAGRHAETIGERLVRDLAVLSGIPEGRFEPCEKKPAKVSSTGLARYRMNDYSVPTRFAFQNVLVKGFVDEVVIVAGSEIIARHGRIYGRDQFVFDPKHYLALLEQKPGALDQAAPLQSWTLPEGFQRIRRLLEERMGNRGKKEFIQLKASDGNYRYAKATIKATMTNVKDAPNTYRTP
jgi:hypothetical protein